MKISEMTTEQAFDCMCVITPYVANITADEKLLNILKDKIQIGKSVSKAEIMVFGAKKLAEIVPLVLKDHKQDVFDILAALNEKTPEEISKQNIIETMKQIRKCVTDEDLIDFFKSWQQEGATE